ncbi:MAG: endonuclease/exonuclease/phosphatase family protein [Clostridia bacterium]|nr:endonuclease/exonuclease/phosphatase family protein [Clostridia bacterium]
MKKILTVLALAVLCMLMSLSAAASTNSSFRVMTFNILNSEDKETRFDAIKTTVSDISPDVLGLQECREGFNTLIADIKATGYASVVDKLVDDPNDSNIINCVPILYNTDRFTLVEGSAGARRFVEKYQESWTKSLCYCVLEDLTDSQRYIVINVHFAVYMADYGLTVKEVCAQRVSNANEVLAQIKTMQNTYGDIPVIVLGDFNAEETEQAYRVLTSELSDTNYISYVGSAFNTSSHTTLTIEQTGGYPIDHIFVSGNDFSVSACLPYITETSYSASDHYPLLADLKYSECTGQTCDEYHKTETPLAIVNVAKRSPFSDVLEGFTVMNVSTEPIDLSHILVWYARATTQEDLDALETGDITKVMRLSSKRGKNILQPGEKAYIWCIFGSTYTASVTTTAGEKALVTKDKSGAPVYNTDVFRGAWNYIATSSSYYNAIPFSDDMAVIPIDCTTRDVFDSETGFRNLANSFNLQNSYFSRLSLSYDTACDVSEAFCSVAVDSTGGGTYIDESGSVVSTIGMYAYTPDGNGSFHPKAFFPSGYSVYNVLSVLKSCINHSTEDVWDMNNDGVINMIDVVRMLRVMVV